MESVQKDAIGGKSKIKAGMNVEELFGRIKQCVDGGDLATAESLREVLMQADTMALSEIVASAELIEEAKLARIEKAHLQIWNELYDTFTSEEKTLFFYSLVKKTLPPKSILIRQGSLNDSLFLLEQGHLAAIFTKEKKNRLVLQVGKGGFVGDDTFFGMSICTSSVVAQSEVVVRILKKNSIHEWDEKAPGLYAKLESFCRKYDRYEEAYQLKRQEDSRFKRVSVHGQVCADILSSAMKQTGHRFKAAIADVSRSGACFFIKSSQKEAAAALVAKPLQMIFSIAKKGGDPVEFMARGRVVKVKFQLENDYSVHVEFSSPLGKEKIELLQTT